LSAVKSITRRCVTSKSLAGRREETGRRRRLPEGVAERKTSATRAIASCRRRLRVRRFSRAFTNRVFQACQALENTRTNNRNGINTFSGHPNPQDGSQVVHAARRVHRTIRPIRSIDGLNGRLRRPCFAVSINLLSLTKAAPTHTQSVLLRYNFVDTDIGANKGRDAMNHKSKIWH